MKLPTRKTADHKLLSFCVLLFTELYIVQNLDSLPFTQADEWNSLTLEELCSLLSHSAVRGPEEVVFLAAEAWIQNNSEGAKDLLDVMHCVDLKRIPEYRLQR